MSKLAISNVSIQGPRLGEGKTCEPVLRDLPNWFGIEEAVERFVSDIDYMPTFLAHQDNNAIGFLSLQKHNPYSYEVYSVGVKMAFHREGIGKRLMQEAEQYLRTQGAEYLQVKTLSDSHPDPSYAKTRAFYNAVGFRPLEELSALWGKENPCLLMIKRL